MAQAINGWPFIAEARFQSQVSPWKICDGQSGTGRGFSPSTISVSIIPAVVIFISTLLLSEGRTGEAWESYIEQCSLGNWGTLCRKTLSTFFFSMRRDKIRLYMEVLRNNLCSTGSNWGWRYIGGWLYLQVTCLADASLGNSASETRILCPGLRHFRHT
jgi:hypothetical protein